MERLSILNSKRTRQVRDLVKEQWGADIPGEHAILENEKGKLYMVSRDFGNIDAERLRIQSVGCYFGEICQGGIRLSIEGSQIVGPGADKNIIEIGDEDAKAWLSGSDLVRDGGAKGFLIIKNRDDFLGCGTFSKGKDRIQNFISKSRKANIIE